MSYPNIEKSIHKGQYVGYGADGGRFSIYKQGGVWNAYRQPGGDKYYATNEKFVSAKTLASMSKKLEALQLKTNPLKPSKRTRTPSLAEMKRAYGGVKKKAAKRRGATSGYGKVKLARKRSTVSNAPFEILEAYSKKVVAKFATRGAATEYGHALARKTGKRYALRCP